MKRENFLWPLSQSHHRALMAARRVREGLSPGGTGSEAEQLAQISAEMKKFHQEELQRHFKDEEYMLDLFESHAGKGDSDSARVRDEHRFLESLLSQNTRESLLKFAETLVIHIRFEEDVLFARVEKAFDDAEKKIVGERLR
jgi:iron-sulfur cluster repair protein YtfE (RIC family)